MTGWQLVLFLILLGGVLATLGDLLGSRVGKARLSVFNLRPRTTAVLMTVITGCLISSLSFFFVLLVNEQLRVGLFQLNQLQLERVELEKRIEIGETELKQLEENLIALRSGDVVIGSGQNLAVRTFYNERRSQSTKIIDSILQEANLNAYAMVLPGENPNKQIILVPREDIKRLEQTISEEGEWVVNIRSAGNVLLGEKVVYAFPEVRPNKNIVSKGEIISEIIIEEDEFESEAVNTKINLLLASTFSEAKRRGSISTGLQFNANSINLISKSIQRRDKGAVTLQSVSLRDSDTADPIFIDLKLKNRILQLIPDN